MGLIMTFEGEQDFPLSAAELWPRLSDARFLVDCVPDAIVQGQPEAVRAQCIVRPGFAFVRGSLDVTLEIAEARANELIRVVALSKGIGSRSEVEARLTISDRDSGSRVHWQVEVKKLGGLLKAVPSGLIRGAAQKVIADMWTQTTLKLAESSGK